MDRAWALVMFDAFHDEEGMTTVGMVLALLVTLALVFSAGQAHWVGSAPSEAERGRRGGSGRVERGGRVHDRRAGVRCGGAVAFADQSRGDGAGRGPRWHRRFTASASETLLKAGRDVAHARDRFVPRRRPMGSTRLQRLLLPRRGERGIGGVGEQRGSRRARRGRLSRFSCPLRGRRSR